MSQSSLLSAAPPWDDSLLYSLYCVITPLGVAGLDQVMITSELDSITDRGSAKPAQVNRANT